MLLILLKLRYESLDQNMDDGDIRLLVGIHIINMNKALRDKMVQLIDLINTYVYKNLKIHIFNMALDALHLGHRIYTTLRAFTRVT